MRYAEPGWIASLLGAAVLIAGGFGLGLVAGVVSEEPELVVGHLVGRSEEVAWLPEGEPEFTPATHEAASEHDEGRLDEVAWEADDRAVPLAPLPAVAAPPPAAPPPAALSPAAPLPAAPLPAAPRDVSSLPEAWGRGSGFVVQVGAFSAAAVADDVKRKLRVKGFESYVVPATPSGDGKWRVRVGPVSTRAGADSLAGRLESEERLPTWVLSEGGG
jgi:cell division septation protein DedD